MIKIPIDLMDGPRFVLRGRVVTMNKNRDIIKDGMVCIDKGKIVAVRAKGEQIPADFAAAKVINTRSTIFPGLIELHNHLSYDILKLWKVPKKYINRDQWAGIADYQKLISGPMNVLGKTPGCVEAVVRYVECKCLAGGVTTSQGIALFSNSGIQKYYRGIVRNVENTDDAALPEALDKIADVEAASAEKFLQRLKKQTCLLLHLSEGTDEKAHQHFKDLQLSNGSWAVTGALAGIHCVVLKNADFKIMKAAGASMVWSPFSNLLLYGQTADISSAIKNKLVIGLGSDWSPSGSKNLFGECKVARLVSKELALFPDDADILAMATIQAAKILKWDKELGSIEAGKKADLMLMKGTGGNAYKQFLSRSESSIALVIINGIPRYGYPDLMENFEEEKEDMTVGNTKYQLYLQQASADTAVGKLSLKAAVDKLQDGLQRLPELARDLDAPHIAALSIANAATHPQWFLVLDHNDEPEGEKLRMTGHDAPELVPAKPLSEVLGPLDLDIMTVAADKDFLSGLQNQINLPRYLKDGLAKMYK